MDAFLRDGHPFLGAVPGPLALAVDADGVLWAAGGGRGASAVLRYDAAGWRAYPQNANGLRAILPLDNGSVLIAGEYGYLARVDNPALPFGSAASPGRARLIDGDARQILRTGTQECLFALAAIAGATWITGDNGFVATLATGASELRVQPRPGSDRVAGVVATPDGHVRLLVGAQLIEQAPDGARATLLTGHAPLTHAAYAPDGTLALAGDAGQLYLAAPGRAPSVYGEASFPPERANEVFVEDVLDDGVLDEYCAASFLRNGKPILRDA